MHKNLDFFKEKLPLSLDDCIVGVRVSYSFCNHTLILGANVFLYF